MNTFLGLFSAPRSADYKCELPRSWLVLSAGIRGEKGSGKINHKVEPILPLDVALLLDEVSNSIGSKLPSVLIG